MKALLHQKTTALVYRTRAEHILVGGFAGFRRARACNFSIGLGAAVTIELPSVANLLNFLEVEVGDEEFVLVAAGLRNNFAVRIAKVTFAVEFPNLPGMLGADAVNGGDKIGIGDGMGGLLELPEIFRETGDGGGRIIDDLRAIEAEDARALRKMTVVTNVHTDAGIACVENRVAGVSRREVKLFPKTRVALRDVITAAVL
jgi:hypothetical protein